MPEFLEMGKYAAFIWSSYAVTGLVLAGLIVASWRFMKGAERRLQALEGARRPVAGTDGAEP